MMIRPLPSTALPDENSFVLRAKNKKGVTVKLNVKDQTTAKENVNIPRDGSTTNAEEDIVYFTKVNGLSASENVIFYLFEGKSNKTLVTKRVRYLVMEYILLTREISRLQVSVICSV